MTFNTVTASATTQLTRLNARDVRCERRSNFTSGLTTSSTTPATGSFGRTVKVLTDVEVPRLPERMMHGVRESGHGSNECFLAPRRPHVVNNTP